ncbi:MAG TPA: SpoIIE family protein phosphatase [Solirubrobacterales bacterium]|nr:SpoIIE family protein phosphatase [Solirubrobacterales bacterium]
MPLTPSGPPEGHSAAVVEFSDDAILTKDRNAVITSWNPGAERIYGYSAEEAIGRPISMLIPEHRAGEEQEILERILAGDRVRHYETERVTKDGREIVVSLTISPVRDESGAVVSASVIARDISDRHRSRELASRLQRLTSALARETTPAAAIEVLLEQAVDALGAVAGAVGLVDESGEEVELAGHLGYSEAGLAGWDRFPLEDDVPMSVAMRSGDPIWASSAEELRARFSGLVEAPLRPGSLAVIPLAVGRDPFGALALSFDAERHFDPEERAFLVTAAQQAAHTLDRARLYEAEQRARQRVSFLARASELLSSSLDVETSLRNLAELAVKGSADWCGIELVEEDGRLRSVATADADTGSAELARGLAGGYPIESRGERQVEQVIESGEPQLHSEITDAMLVETAGDEDQLRSLRRMGLTSAMIVPLQARGKTVGAITFVSSQEDRRFGEEDLDLVQDLARRAALAIDNAMLFRRDHEAAVTLQRALLPESLPEVDGVEFAARYEPAGPGLEVGGDWYEVVVRDDGCVGLMIGDVAGHGIRAAAMMGRLRPALRAYMLDARGPEQAIARLNHLMSELDHSQMTTLFHLQFDPLSGTATYVRAGHPPALLRLPTGHVNELSGGGAPPLGVFEGFDCRPHKVEIPPGSLLVLYTDGLVERRRESLDVGLDRLKRSLARAPAQAERCLDWLISADGEEILDDVAMLAMGVGQTRSGSSSGSGQARTRSGTG